MSINLYNKKRNFDSTKEPKGVVRKARNNRFVVQYHKARSKHYDFRLEYDGVLLSWAVPKGLSDNPKTKRLAVHVEDHPVDYVDFEGIIPEGNYGAGTVEIYDKGNYLAIEDFDAGLKKGHLKFVLNGEVYKGGWSLIRLEKDEWLIVKSDDDFAKKIKRKSKTKVPFVASVQLATLSQQIPTGKDWIYEIKYDGYRILTYIENGKIQLLSRNGQDYTKKFQNIVEGLQKIEADSLLVDGEVVVFDKFGRSDFSLLKESIKNKNNDFCYVIFDLLAVNGEDLRDLPLIERKEKLKRLIYKVDKSLIYSEHVDKGKESFNFAKQNNLEGIIAKKKNSKYLGKRTDDWLKIKCYLRQEFIIVGYTTSSKNEILSAMLLGYYEKNKLKFIGKVGTGFNKKDKEELNAKFNKIIRKTCPLEEKLSLANVTWLKPELVAEIQFAELTKDKILRQPSFIGLRTDKKAKDVTLEVGL